LYSVHCLVSHPEVPVQTHPLCGKRHPTHVVESDELVIWPGHGIYVSHPYGVIFHGELLVPVPEHALTSTVICPFTGSDAEMTPVNERPSDTASIDLKYWKEKPLNNVTPSKITGMYAPVVSVAGGKVINVEEFAYAGFHIDPVGGAGQSVHPVVTCCVRLHTVP
jgi:hypothetical protein